MDAQFSSAQAEIDHCLRREREERDAACDTTDTMARDTHVMEAERFADRAWSLSEEGDAPFVPSGLWR